MEVYCPFCEIEFEAERYEGGNCPQCNREYIWYEECTSDYSDCWDAIDWIEEDDDDDDDW